jgi:hypothetical protein
VDDLDEGEQANCDSCGEPVALELNGGVRRVPAGQSGVSHGRTSNELAPH